jgi:hypothetical protein
MTAVLPVMVLLILLASIIERNTSIYERVGVNLLEIKLQEFGHVMTAHGEILAKIMVKLKLYEKSYRKKVRRIKRRKISRTKTRNRINLKRNVHVRTGVNGRDLVTAAPIVE